ncbi:MAG: DUF362 domain-containing protein [Verrucomicrobiae bacterium]|nr:DUF362 domain-containing protein [Verrucomicrobiae bacterium]
MRWIWVWLLVAQVGMADQPVVRVRDAGVLDQGTVRAERVREMVRVGIMRLTGAKTEREAWQTLFGSNDVVGIKIATMSAPLQATRPAVVAAIRDGLVSAGVATTNVVVFDRDPHKLRAAGFSDALAIAPDGWDEEQFYESRLVGRLIWGDRLFGREEHGFDTRSHLPLVVTRRVTKLISVPVLQDHEACGVAGTLYNLSLGMVDNARRFETSHQNGDPDIVAINEMSDLRQRVVLHVMDGLVGGYAGGPVFRPKFSWEASWLAFSRDPVGLDAMALGELERQRREAKIPAIGKRAAHIQTAAARGLGRMDAPLIELTLEAGGTSQQP